jgi:fatty-acid desaturase
MSYDFLSLASHGLIDLPWWGYVVVALVVTHVTIASVTIFLHRAQAHRALDLHPAVSHFFRFWLWLTTGMLAASASSNEVGYITHKVVRSLGLLAFDNQARV